MRLSCCLSQINTFLYLMFRLPYVEAVLLEILRMYAVVPMAGPRTVSSDTVLDDFIIPKVCLNIK